MSSDKAKREPREFELKLEFDPADLAAIEAHPLLAGIRLVRQTLVSVYYDTDTLALHEAGLCLRVRNTGKGSVPTVKSMRGMGAGGQRPSAGSQTRYRHAARSAVERRHGRALAAAVPDQHRTRRLSCHKRRVRYRGCRRSRRHRDGTAPGFRA